jgi:hypothetical protein
MRHWTLHNWGCLNYNESYSIFFISPLGQCGQLVEFGFDKSTRPGKSGLEWMGNPPMPSIKRGDSLGLGGYLIIIRYLATKRRKEADGECKWQ